jgi:capsular exopolysaccharide synthesis family protein
LLNWRRRKPVVVSVRDTASEKAQAFRTLRANLMAMGMSSGLQCLLVTSPSWSREIGETAANLAAVSASAGRRTILLSVDFNRSIVHLFFSLDSDPGLSAILTARTSFRRAAISGGIKNLRVVPAGQPGDGLSDALASPRMEKVLTEARGLADVVIIEGPALSDSSDTVTLATMVDAALLVVRAGVDRHDRLAGAGAALQQAGAPLAGIYLAHADPRDRTAGAGVRASGWGAASSNAEGTRASLQGADGGNSRAVSADEPIRAGPSHEL